MLVYTVASRYKMARVAGIYGEICRMSVQIFCILEVSILQNAHEYGQTKYIPTALRSFVCCVMSMDLLKRILSTTKLTNN